MQWNLYNYNGSPKQSFARGVRIVKSFKFHESILASIGTVRNAASFEKTAEASPICSYRLHKKYLSNDFLLIQYEAACMQIGALGRN